MTFLIPRYEELIATIIRPEREDYELDELGPKRIDLYGKIVKREDFTIIT